MNVQPITLGHISSVISLVVGFLYILQVGLINKNKKESNKIFFLYLLNLNFIILFFFLLDIGLSNYLKYFVPFITSSILLISPLLWMYIKKLVYPNYKLKINKHFLPSIVIGTLLTLLEISIYTIQIKSYQEIALQIMTYVTIASLTFIFIIQCNYYTYLSYNLYKKHQINVANLFSYSENIDLKWIRVLLIGFISFIVSMIVINLMDGLLSDVLFDSLMTIYIIYIGINALNQKEIYTHETTKINSYNRESSQSEKQNLIDEFNVAETIQIPEIQPELVSQLKQELLKKLNEEKIFRDQDLSIYKLSKELNTNSKYLSIIINKEFKKNFVNFVNEFRIEDAKINLKSEQFKNHTIEAHGQQVGFKSKSSFNNAFKKFTGKTPSEFLKTT